MSSTKKPSVLDRVVLTTIQRDAVSYCNGPELVFAGAGTGKTRVLTAKIAYLLENGYYPGQIFAATFTNKAAREMRDRIESLVEFPVDKLWIGTFHSLCTRILRRESGHIGYIRDFSIYDSSDQLSLVKKVQKDFGIDDRTMPPKFLQSAISKFKSQSLTPDEASERYHRFQDQETIRVYKEYQKRLVQQQAMDFDDLLCNVVWMFKKNETLLETYRNLFRYILVDEYQDTNMVQFQLIKLLAEKHQKLFAVGDDDQSIYGWRGARIENILSFEKEFPNTKIFKLEQNYRSTKSILSFANAVISENINRAQKELWTTRPQGENVKVIQYRDDRQEADHIGGQIDGLLKQGVHGSDIAIIFRTNAQSRSFEENLRRRKIPFILVGGMEFYERAEIKDCLAFLRLIVNPHDDISFERIYNSPARGLGEKAFESLANYAKEKNKSLLETILHGDISILGPRYQKGFSELKEIFSLLTSSYQSGGKPASMVKDMLELTGYIEFYKNDQSEESQNRYENIQELVNAIQIWEVENTEKNLADFLEEVSLISDIDSWDRKDDFVNLMTLHCAKGLEFKYVFIVGVEEGIIPSRQNLSESAKIEEERRLFYVGITRGMEKVVCTHAGYRYRFGQVLPSQPSSFLSTISSNLFTFVDESFSFDTVEEIKKPSFTPTRTFQTSYTGNRAAIKPTVKTEPPSVFPDDFSQETVQYRIGQQVSHKKYGRGRILSLSGFGDDMKMTVLFNDGSRVKLMAKFVKFEK